MELVLYEQEEGRCPFDDWLSGLRDKRAQARIIFRLRQIESGNLGDSSAIGQGVLELRIHVDAGYRVYCGRFGAQLVVLLCGGDKSSQARDIHQAQLFWADWKRRHHAKE